MVLIEAKSSENYSSSISCGGEYFKSVDIYKIQYTFKSKITQINNEYNDAASISDCEGNQFNYLDNLSSRIIFFPPRDLTRFLDSIVIQGVVYNNILESILIDSTLNTEQQVYFAKNIGRIKFLRIENVDTLFDSELKRYHVSPF